MSNPKAASAKKKWVTPEVEVEVVASSTRGGPTGGGNPDDLIVYS